MWRVLRISLQVHSELQAVGYGNDSDKNKARVESHKYQQVGKHSCESNSISEMKGGRRLPSCYHNAGVIL